MKSQERVICPACGKEVTTTRTVYVTEANKWHPCTITRRHLNNGVPCSVVVSVDLKANA